MFLFNQQNLCKNWNCYFWRFQSFLWNYPPTQTKVWLSLIKICVVIVHWKPLKRGLKAAHHIWRNPYLQTCHSCSTFLFLKAEVTRTGRTCGGSPPDARACESPWLWQPGRFLWSPVTRMQRVVYQISTMRRLSKTVFAFTTSFDQRWSRQPVICCTW